MPSYFPYNRIVLYVISLLSIGVWNHTLFAQEYIHIRGKVSPWFSQDYSVRYPSLQIPQSVTSAVENTPVIQEIGIETGIPLFKPFSFSLGFDIFTMAVVSNGNEQTTFSLNGLPVDGVIRHSIRTNLTGIQVMPALTATLSSLRLSLGFPYAMPLYGHASHTQNIVAPDELRGSLLTDAQIKQDITSQMKAYFSVYGSIFYALPVNTSRTWWLMPGITFQQSLASIVNENSITPLSAGLSLGIQYAPSLQTPTTLSQEVRDTTIEKEIQPTAIIDTSLTRTEKEIQPLSETSETAPIVQKTISPILTGDIRASFLSHARNTEKSIILKRYVEYRQTNIIIPISLKSTVTEYLSQRNYKEEKYSDQNELMTIMSTDTLVYVQPSIIRVQHKALSESGLVSWKIFVKQQERLLREIRGSASLPDYTDIDINDIEYFDKAQKSLSISMELTDSEGQTFQSQDVVASFTFSSTQTKPDFKGKITLLHPSITTQQLNSDDKQVYEKSHKKIHSQCDGIMFPQSDPSKSYWNKFYCSKHIFQEFTIISH